MRRLLLVFCLLSAAGCLGNGPTAPTPFDGRIVLAPGERAGLAADLSVRFVGVLGDSRCPADALCIQGGDAIVRVEITTGTASAERDLHTGDMQPVVFERTRVELLQLDPYPFSSRPIQPGDYRATLRVTR
jgi:hypothetical protein